MTTLYSASMEDKEIVACSLLCHEPIPKPSVNAQLVDDFLVSIDPAQSKLVYPTNIVIARFAPPLLSCTKGLFPFSYADLSSLFDESRAKNTHFFTYTHPICYTTCVYAGCSTTARVHRDLCQKIQKWSWVSMSRHEISDPWPSTY
jgi:hypothetical protein